MVYVVINCIQQSAEGQQTIKTVIRLPTAFHFDTLRHVIDRPFMNNLVELLLLLLLLLLMMMMMMTTTKATTVAEMTGRWLLHALMTPIHPSVSAQALA